LYNARAWSQIGLNPGLFDPKMLEPFVWQFNSRGDFDLSFGRRFRSVLRDAANVEVLLHANVTELVPEANGRMIKHARIRTFNGCAHTVRARCFILACGGIENARLLLASTAIDSNGIGNERGLVGRFFHEHLELPCGMLVAPLEGNDAAQYSRLHRFGRTACLPGLRLAPSAQAARGTPNTSLSVDPLYDKESGFVALQMLRSDFRRRRISSETLKRLWRAAVDSADWAPEAWRRFVHWDRPKGDPRRYILFARSEQTPNAQSRISLSRETDELGMPVALLDWHTTSADQKGVRLAASFAIDEFRRLGIGQILEAEWMAGADWPGNLAGGPHHMGTTRMAVDPGSGVVDKDCKVFGVEGLYIAGSSVFPTGGHANPTLSILALALRLADHVRACLSCDKVTVSLSAKLRSPATKLNPAMLVDPVEISGD
jgi:choline dehydrogenase-like flavoprotein